MKIKLPHSTIGNLQKPAGLDALQRLSAHLVRRQQCEFAGHRAGRDIDTAFNQPTAAGYDEKHAFGGLALAEKNLACSIRREDVKGLSQSILRLPADACATWRVNCSISRSRMTLSGNGRTWRTSGG